MNALNDRHVWYVSTSPQAKVKKDTNRLACVTPATTSDGVMYSKAMVDPAARQSQIYFTKSM